MSTTIPPGTPGLASSSHQSYSTEPERGTADPQTQLLLDALAGFESRMDRRMQGMEDRLDRVEDRLGRVEMAVLSLQGDEEASEQVRQLLKTHKH